MPTQQVSEHAAFNEFVVERLGDDLGGKSLEDAVAEFRAYQRELEKLRAKVAIAVGQSAAGVSEELDDATFWEKVDPILDSEGIPE
jgi:hypothetical protein